MADPVEAGLETVLNRPNPAVAAAVADPAAAPQMMPFDRVRDLIDKIPVNEQFHSEHPIIGGFSPISMLKSAATGLTHLMEAASGARQEISIEDTLAMPGPGMVASRFYPVGSLGVFGSRIAPESGVFKKLTEGVRTLGKMYGDSKGNVVLANVDPMEVLKHTGMSKDKVGNWVYEIDDSVASATTEFNNLHLSWGDRTIPSESLGEFAKSFVNGQVPLQQVLKHNELFDAFPYLKNIAVIPMSADEVAKGWTAYFNTESRHIALNMDMRGSELLSVLMHETQHAVNATEQTFKLRRSGGEVFDPEYIKQSLTQFARVYNLAGKKGLLSPEQSQEISNFIAGFREHGDFYKRNTGEVEARNVQTRLDFSRAERNAIPPEHTEDYMRKDQLDLYEFRSLYARGQKLGMFPPEPE